MRSPMPPTRSAADPRRLLLILAVVVAAILSGQHLRGMPPGPGLVSQVASSAAPEREPRPSPALRQAVTAGTSGRFAYATGRGRVVGSRGPIRRYKVAVERPAGAATITGFADDVDRTLADRRSWIAGRQFRLQRVPQRAYAEFTVFLASARTSERMCRTGGLETAGFTSCRLPRQVIINDSRWRGAVPRYGASLATYRAYAINHEVGHQLGHGHETCPGRGRPAPVMMQQTYGLKGCTANAWPFPGGRRYTGPPVP